MYNIEFYENQNGESEVREFILDTEKESQHSKDKRILLKKIYAFLDAIEENGLVLSDNIIRKIQNDLWEIKPNNIRILFYPEGNKIYLLTWYNKKSQKLPLKERKKAERIINIIKQENEK